jgi:serine protease
LAIGCYYFRSWGTIKMLIVKRALGIALILALLFGNTLFVGQAAAVTDASPFKDGTSSYDLSQAEYAPDQIIVKFKEGVLNNNEDSLNSLLGTEVIDSNLYSRVKLLRIPEGKTVPEMVETYSRETIVEYAEPNYIYHITWSPDDTRYSEQWNFGHINLETAWDLDTTAPNYGGDPSIIVAIVDTGVAYENYSSYTQAPDLANTHFTAGYDYVHSDAHANDDNGHGTHVCGTIAQSTNNALGVAGIAFNTTIMPVKVLDEDGYGYVSWVANGIYYAVNHGARIINMSLGGTGTSTTLRNAVANAYTHGVVVVCSAGNDYTHGNPASYPAAYDDYCIAVGATRYDNTHAYYSTTGSYVDIVAPGGDVTVDQDSNGHPDGILQQTFATEGVPNVFDYEYYQGTSMACPHVVGVAALLLAKNPTWTPDQVRNALQRTATDLGTAGRDDVYGWGLLNAAAALSVTPMAITTEGYGQLTSTSARLLGTLNSLGTDSSAVVSFQYGTTTACTGGTSTPKTLTSAVYFGIPVTGLTPGTTYYFKARAVGSGTTYGSVLSFATTGGATPPTITTEGSAQVTGTSVRLLGTLNNLGSATSVSVSFLYGTTTACTGGASTAKTLTAALYYGIPVSGLTPGTTYYFKARAVGSSTVYGSVLSFTTTGGAIPPTITTEGSSQVTGNSARLLGTLNSLGSATSVAVSFLYGTTTACTDGSSFTKTLTTTAYFGIVISGLAPGTTYYFKAMAVGSSTIYGSVLSFTTTGGDTPPTITTESYSQLTSTSVRMLGTLNSLGTASSVAVAFIYGTTTACADGVSFTKTLTSAVYFGIVVTGLTPNTTYYFRARAIGTSTVYGAVLSFITASGGSSTAMSATYFCNSSAKYYGDLAGGRIEDLVLPTRLRFA